MNKTKAIFFIKIKLITDHFELDKYYNNIIKYMFKSVT